MELSSEDAQPKVYVFDMTDPKVQKIVTKLYKAHFQEHSEFGNKQHS